MERIILHCDCNSFYASVELLSYPDLCSCPVAVCGDPASRHGIILAKNELAKTYGIKTAETIWQAQEKCPQLVLLPAHHERYVEYSKKINAIYEQYTDLVEPFGIDESWLDISGTLHLLGGNVRQIADEIRARTKKELGLTISIGVSFNKVFAKLGSDYKKPDATTIISSENFRELVWPLPVSDLLFVGKSSAELLHQYHVKTIGDLAAFDPEILFKLMGKRGTQLWYYANGMDQSSVLPAGIYVPPKSIGNGETFAKNLTTREEIHRGVTLLSDSIATQLRQHHLRTTTLQVTIRDPMFKDICRQKPLVGSTCVARELAEAAMELILASWKPGSPIRALTLTAHHLIPENESGQQLDLFGSHELYRRDKLEKLERTMDHLRQKFGQNAVYSAASSSSQLHSKTRN